MLWSELSPDRNLIPGFAPLFSSCVHRFSPGILVSSHSPKTGSSGWLETLNCPQVWMNGMCTLQWTDDLYWGNKKQSQTDEWTGLTLSRHLQQVARQRFMSVCLSASKQTRCGWFKWSYLQRWSSFRATSWAPLYSAPDHQPCTCRTSRLTTITTFLTFLFHVLLFR